MTRKQSPPRTKRRGVFIGWSVYCHCCGIPVSFGHKKQEAIKSWIDFTGHNWTTEYAMGSRCERVEVRRLRGGR